MDFAVGTGNVTRDILHSHLSYEIWSTATGNLTQETTLNYARVLSARLSFGPCGASRAGRLRVDQRPSWPPYSKIVRVRLVEIGSFYAGLLTNVVPDGDAWALELAGLNAVMQDALVADPSAPALPAIPGGVVAAGGRNLGGVTLTAGPATTYLKMTQDAIAGLENAEWGVGGDLVNVIGRPDGSGAVAATYAVDSSTLNLNRYGYVLLPAVTQWANTSATPRQVGGLTLTGADLIRPRRYVERNPLSQPPEASLTPYTGPAHEFRVGKAIVIGPLLVTGLTGNVSQYAAGSVLEVSRESIVTQVLTSALPRPTGSSSISASGAVRTGGPSPSR